MGEQQDLLPNITSPDRVYYETGVLLDAADFKAEQDYHRGRLARALSYVIGTGTVAGLKVVHEPEVPADEINNIPGRDERIVIEPGLAIDTYGRMIEVPRHVCFRLNKWYQEQEAQDLIQGWHNADGAYTGAPAGVVLDLVIKFVDCERGKTPSFAVGPFEAIDAITASRIRDGYEAQLIIRKEENPPLPQSQWPDFPNLPEADRVPVLRDAIFNAWRSGAASSESILLARIVIEASEATSGEAPQRLSTLAVAVNNEVRPFVYSTAVLASWLGIT